MTKNECGGSEFYHAFDKIGARSPKVDAVKSRQLYEKMYELNQKSLLSSCAAIGWGGFLITLAKMSIAGLLGTEVDISKIPNEGISPEKILYSESQSRFIATIDPKNQEMFENMLSGFVLAKVGTVTNDGKFLIKNNDTDIISSDVKKVEQVYKERFKDF